jgi:23S rRNA (guanine745-N1)-methyltransferase
MVLARRAFLSGGYYEPLVKQVSEAILSVTPSGGAVLDAGSGEGYYTDAVERALFNRDGKTNVLAFDISKDAVREVARKNKRISLAVAGSYHMPIADCSIDTVLNTFSPLALDEVRRALRARGAFVMAIPGEEHLYDLKCRVYDTPYKNTVADTSLEGFVLEGCEHIKYKFGLDSREAIKNLFMMTPYAYRTPREMRERVLTLDGFECTADFYLLTYRKL